MKAIETTPWKQRRGRYVCIERIRNAPELLLWAEEIDELSAMDLQEKATPTNISRRGFVS